MMLVHSPKLKQTPNNMTNEPMTNQSQRAPHDPKVKAIRDPKSKLGDRIVTTWVIGNDIYPNGQLGTIISPKPPTTVLEK